MLKNYITELRLHIKKLNNQIEGLKKRIPSASHKELEIILSITYLNMISNLKLHSDPLLRNFESSAAPRLGPKNFVCLKK